ncbi:MAG: PH domain-containing protein [Ruminococcus sp.]|nr:PH domain-containing protein [Ruminococcus sp.]
MSVNFNQDSVFNLKEIKLESIRKDVDGLLVNGEEPVMAFHTVRDQLVFTNRRIIAIDIQGVTGTRKSFTSMPYARIQYFSIQTPGFGEMFSDTELFVMFSNRFTARFEFKSKTDIGKIARLIADYALR